MAYYRQPKFYRDFHCMGGSCPNSCCAIWRIDWTKEEVEKLKSAECSPELRQLIETSFIAHKDTSDLLCIDINPKTKFDCPFLDKDRMCRIQRELGEEYLSYTCTVYPRTTFYSNNVMYRTCSASCYQVLKTLNEDKKAMGLVNVSPNSSTVAIRATNDTPAFIQKHPELKYRVELFELFYEIISNEKRTLNTSLILGALAAQKISQFVERGEADRIPEIIKALRPQLNTLSIPAFENVKKNYHISLELVAEIVNSLESSNGLDSIKENGAFSVKKYEHGRAVLEEYLSDKPHFFRNIALNFLFEGKIPFISIKHTIFENYAYYASTIAAAKLIQTAICARDNAISKTPFVLMSYYIRGMYHSADSKLDELFEKLKENGCNSPAFIALMLK